MKCGRLKNNCTNFNCIQKRLSINFVCFSAKTLLTSELSRYNFQKIKKSYNFYLTNETH